MPKIPNADVTLEWNTTQLGLMLAVDPQTRRKLWATRYASALSPQYFTGQAEYSSLPPEQELAISQDEWHAGFGEEKYEDGRRYGSSYGGDARTKGRIKVGPLVNQTLIKCGVVNYGFEAWDNSNCNNWTKDAGTLAKETTTIHGGDSAVKLSSTADTAAYLYQAVAGWQYLVGKSVTFTCYVKASDADKVRISIRDGQAYSYSSYHTGDGEWAQLTATRTIHADATKVEVGLHVYTASITAYFDDAAMTSTMATITDVAVAFAEIGSNLYLATDSDVCWYDETNDQWTIVHHEASNTITDLCKYTDDSGNTYFFLAEGTEKYKYASDPMGTWTTATPAESVAHLFASIAGTLWKASLPNKIKSATDPTNAVNPWSTEYTIGTNATNIRDILSFEEGRYIAKEDGLYSATAAGVASVILDYSSVRATDNGKQSYSWGGDGSLYFPYGGTGLGNYDGTTVTANISPKKYGPQFDDLHGQIVAIAGDVEWLYVIAKPTGSNHNSILFAVRKESIGGSTDYRWHPIAEIGIDDVRTAWVSSLQNESRLWIAGRHTNASNEDKPVYLKLDSSEFDTSVTFITPYYNAQFVDINKAFFSFTLLSKNLSSGHRQVKVEWEKDADTSWTELNGSGTGSFVTSPSETIYFQADTYGKKIRFRLTLTTDDTTSPEVHGIIIRGMLRPAVRKLFDFTIKCADGVVLRDGKTQSSLTGKKIDTDLHTARSEAWPITLYDRRGTSWSIALLQIEEAEIAAEPDEKLQTALHIVALETKIA